MLSGPYTERDLRRLITRASEARRAIVAGVVDAAQSNDHVYWGQFLDLPRRSGQRGIYGTCAAIEILLANGFGADNELVVKGVSDLPLLGNGTDYGDPFDLGLVFKVAAIVTVGSRLDPDLRIDQPPAGQLLRMAVDDRGWGNYAFPDSGVRDPAPQVVPTAVSLLALERVPRWRAEPRCARSVEWLAQAMLSGGTADAEDALGLLALLTYRVPGVEVSGWRDAVDAVRQRVIEKLAQGSGVPEATRYHYPVTLPNGGYVNHYMFFLPACVGALALLKERDTARVGGAGQVCRLVSTVARRISADRGYRASDHLRIATVDQLWTDRLLAAFVSAGASPATLLPAFVAPLATRTGRRLALGVTALVGTAASILSIGDLVPGLARGLFGAVAAVALGLFVTAFRWFGE